MRLPDPGDQESLDHFEMLYLSSTLQTRDHLPISPSTRLLHVGVINSLSGSSSFGLWSGGRVSISPLVDSPIAEVEGRWQASEQGAIDRTPDYSSYLARRLPCFSRGLLA